MIHLKSVASMSLHARKVGGIISEQDDSQWTGETPLTDELVDACGVIGNCWVSRSRPTVTPLALK
jgi:hypothetical protein